MEDLEDKTNEELGKEYHALVKAHTDLKEKMIKVFDVMLTLEKRGEKVYKTLKKRVNGQ